MASNNSQINVHVKMLFKGLENDAKLIIISYKLFVLLKFIIRTDIMKNPVRLMYVKRF